MSNAYFHDVLCKIDAETILLENKSFLRLLSCGRLLPLIAYRLDKGIIICES